VTSFGGTSAKLSDQTPDRARRAVNRHQERAITSPHQRRLVYKTFKDHLFMFGGAPQVHVELRSEESCPICFIKLASDVVR